MVARLRLHMRNLYRWLQAFALFQMQVVALRPAAAAAVAAVAAARVPAAVAAAAAGRVVRRFA